MSTSSDSGPKLADLINKSTQDADRNSQDSGLPFWIQTATPIKVDDDSNENSPIQSRPSSRAPTETDAGAGPSAENASGNAATQDDNKAAPAAAGQRGSAAIASKQQVPLILPERLVRHKVLIELEPAPHQATELSGDAGAVGRLIANSNTADRGEFKLDLKGVLYHAAVQPLAGTALVINIGQTEAKVESVFSDFVRLKEEQSYVGMTTLEGSYGMDELMADDEDNYQAVAVGEEEVHDKKPAKTTAVKRSKASSSNKAGTASKALKATKAGVKKKPGVKKPGKPKTGASKSKGAAGNAAKGSAAKATKPSAGKAASAGKASKIAKKKKVDSEEEDDWDSDYSN